MPLHLIQTLPEYTDLLERLRLEPLVAVDTEAASFHRHKDRVYLLQLSTRTETHLVDPLAVAGLPGFGELLADPAVELVFHDADYDLRLLGYEFGFRAEVNKVHVHDLHATILRLMGFDHEKFTYRYAGRDFRLTDVHGQVVQELIA